MVHIEPGDGARPGSPGGRGRETTSAHLPVTKLAVSCNQPICTPISPKPQGREAQWIYIYMYICIHLYTSVIIRILIILY